MSDQERGGRPEPWLQKGEHWEDGCLMDGYVLVPEVEELIHVENDSVRIRIANLPVIEWERDELLLLAKALSTYRQGFVERFGAHLVMECFTDLVDRFDALLESLEAER